AAAFSFGGGDIHVGGLFHGGDDSATEAASSPRFAGGDAITKDASWPQVQEQAVAAREDSNRDGTDTNAHLM
ncbi:MAG: hypothetical protein ACKPKO_28420, partial [Candidatus Fonsibacter sp.]